MRINELGAATGIDPGKLGRIMRYLATTHVFQEGVFRIVCQLLALSLLNMRARIVKQDVFANNRLSVQLLEGNPGYALMKFRSVPPVANIHSFI